MNPWDRQQTEQDREWAAFSAYRDAGLHRSFQASGLPLADTLVMAKAHQWRTRVRAWDDHVEAACSQAREDAAKAAAARIAQEQVESISLAFDISVHELRAMAAVQREGDGTAKTLDPRVVAKLLELATKHWALLQGKPTDSLKISLEDLTPEELAALLGKS